MARTYLRGRVVASRRVGAVAAGDLVAIALFAILGQASHAGTAADAAVTFVEFGLGWVVAAPVLGAYGSRAIDSPGRAAALGIGAWLVAAVVGAVVRAAVEPGASLSPVFVLVTAGVGAVLLGAWRALAAILL